MGVGDAIRDWSCIAFLFACNGTCIVKCCHDCLFMFCLSPPPSLACHTVTLEPGNREYLCRVAKQWSDLTYEEGATVEQIQEVNAKAMEYAERVVAMAPKVGGGVGKSVDWGGVRGVCVDTNATSPV